MTTPEERISALENELEDVRELLVGLLNAAPVDAPPAGPPPPPPPPVPRRWAARATPDDWTALMDWVDGLITGYSLFGDYAPPPCWPAHPGVVEELAALWRAWIVATLADETTGPDGSEELSTWHDKALWPTLRRLEKAHYATSSCADRHEPDRTNRELTDRVINASRS
jgi:hypothetical protein